MIFNQQRQVRVRVAGLDGFLSLACRAVKIPRDSLSICLVSGARIARWNLAYRGKRGPTDVLSFGADDSSDLGGSGFPDGSRASLGSHAGRKAGSRNSKSEYLGDIAICPAVAKRNARRFGRTLDNELRILILHGILHLMGYDHQRDTGQMDRREGRLRRALGLS